MGNTNSKSVENKVTTIPIITISRD